MGLMLAERWKRFREGRRRRRGLGWTLLRVARLPAALGLATLGFWSCTMRMPGRSYEGPLPPLTDAERGTAARLRGHVEDLAGPGEHNVDHLDALRRSEEGLTKKLESLGYAVERQELSAGGAKVANLVVERRGASPDLVLVGAHYDSAHGAPGADDNASGVAAMLEIARALSGASLRHTLRFVAFVNEEPPWFQNEGMGSREHARRCRARGERIRAMISLETMGYYRDDAGTQKYPPPMSAFYPSRGNFIGFVGDVGSRDLVRRVVGAFRRRASFPSEGAALPAFIPGVGWSDQWSFWQEGYPGIMVTDTAPFRYPYYHTLADTPDKLDYERLARVTVALTQVIQEIADDP